MKAPHSDRVLPYVGPGTIKIEARSWMERASETAAEELTAS
jgi:hypothetical protein